MIRLFLKENKQLLIFLLFLFFYFVCGIYLTCFNDVVSIIRHDLIYNLDTGRVISEFMDFNYPIKIFSHPFCALIFRSTYLLFNNIIHIVKLDFVFMQSTLGASNVLIFYNILKYLNINKKTILLFTLVFGLSYSNIIFASLPECYILSGFANLLLIFYSIYLCKNNKPISFINIFIFSFLAAICTGINLVNITNSFILIFLVFIYKSKHFKMSFFVYLIKIILTFICIFMCLSFMQQYKFPDANAINTMQGLIKKNDNYSQLRYYYDSRITLEKTKYALLHSFITPIYALTAQKIQIETTNLNTNASISHDALDFSKKQNWVNFIPAIVFYIATLSAILKNRKDILKKDIFFILLSIIILNFAFNLCFENQHCFLYSQNFLSYLIIFLALIQNHLSEKVLCYINFPFLSYQFIINFINIHLIGNFLKQYSNNNYNLIFWIICAIIITFVFGAILILIKNIVKNYFIKNNLNDLYAFFISIYLLYIMKFIF